ncbi:pre-mRNA processing factor 3-domain-containing protein [Gigaspora rosea]|uniref:Pre-mRNA processing factor 3-domain-containing protein n=1 Tax=Gigaspora rosea TaxID=44941 RepID=A0A397U6N3_9GLOM|nr:pre-mRNA processing factor 3-domain-containing protein [Gigaspora rosea]
MDQRKRRTANVFGDEDEPMVKVESDSKKFKNVNVGVPSFIPTPTDPTTVQNAAPRPDQIKAMIAQKRAQLEAMAANFKPAQPKTTLPVQPPAVPNLPYQPSMVVSGIDPDLKRKIQEAKEKIKVNLAKANPYLPSTNPLVKMGDDSIKAKGGLKVESHPALLLDQSGKLDLKRASALMPKPNFATVKANQRLAPAISKQEAKALTPSEELDDITQNPYYDPRAGAVAPQRRVRKKFKFVQRGKYEALGNQMRAQAKLEKLKEEIAESVKKAGMEAEIDSTDKAIKRDPPPVIEWWDLPFLRNKTYDDIDAGLTKIDDEDSLATWFVQHPVPIRPPGDNGPPPPKPLILTKREQKKLRKQRRLELQKEKQDKIRLGLLPPDLPKVKLSNLMRVLTNDAVQDPTKIEAQVRREMQKRQETHQKANEERKLTDEQKKEKKQKKMEEDKKMATIVCVFKINDLSHPKMKFKVDMNAQQLGLSGTVIINPNFTVVIVEGGPKAIKYYKKLMLRRIDWSDTTRIGEGTSEQPADEPMEPPKENKCSLIWEGEVKDHGFKGFWFKTCPTEKMARDYLRKHKSEHYWDLACKYVDDGIEF